MHVSELGEFGLIDLLAKMVVGSRDQKSPSWQNLVIGIGDDAAVWKGDNSLQLATVDSLIQDIHFSLEVMPWYELGWKSLAVNLSDIAAMGGVPKYALVSLALPGETEVGDVEQFYRGMLALAGQHGVALVGGDTCRAPLVAITITVLGGAAGRGQQVLRRAAARPGDKIAVTGYLGGAAVGWEMLSQQLALPAESADVLRNAFFCPQPRVAEGQILVGAGVKTAIDISDGLLADLGHICQASGVGAKVRSDLVPVHPAVTENFPKKALELALTGGEDYELLFAASPAILEKVKKLAGCPVTTIGSIEEGEAGAVHLVDISGKPVSFARAGWDHFKAE